MPTMKEQCFGYYGTRVYLPFSALSRDYRRFRHRVTGKKRRSLQDIRLSRISWRRCTRRRSCRLVETRQLNGNVRISELAILATLAADCPDESSLFEIGTFDGRTTINLAVNAPIGCRVWTLDLPPEVETRFELSACERHMVDKPTPGLRYEKYRAARATAVGKITQLLGDSAAFDYAPYEGRCSLVFIDGSHSYDYVMADTQIGMRLVRPGGVIIWHDYGVWEGVTRALEEIDGSQRLGLRNIRGTSLVYWRSKCAPQGAPPTTSPGTGPARP